MERCLAGGIPDGAEQGGVGGRVEDGLFPRFGGGPCGGRGQDLGQGASAEEVVGGRLLPVAGALFVSPQVGCGVGIAGGLGDHGGDEAADGLGTWLSAVEPAAAGSEVQGGFADGVQARVEGAHEFTRRPAGALQGVGEVLVLYASAGRR